AAWHLPLELGCAGAGVGPARVAGGAFGSALPCPLAEHGDQALHDEADELRLGGLGDEGQADDGVDASDDLLLVLLDEAEDEGEDGAEAEGAEVVARGGGGERVGGYHDGVAEV